MPTGGAARGRHPGAAGAIAAPGPEPALLSAGQKRLISDVLDRRCRTGWWRPVPIRSGADVRIGVHRVVLTPGSPQER
ncbi:hypothetical protein E1161_08520 [Saccharopolyspora aridisoli]|uniref:Uncharacterized protein n=1 Tax=Saccharopolyspora aridisoli TaxID=2530385 RepID=A0A4R4UYU9_9PSEU|nr:hypothetical protein E1161_08520 [Saccharopolyspora aridisoli]